LKKFTLIKNFLDCNCEVDSLKRAKSGDMDGAAKIDPMQQ